MNIKRFIKDEYDPAFDYELIEDLADQVGFYIYHNGGSFLEAIKEIGKDGRYSKEVLDKVSARANEMIDMGAFGNEDESLSGVADINSSQEANKWLNEQLERYGNTRYFPSDVNNTLNSLIEEFGNTYFWK